MTDEELTARAAAAWETHSAQQLLTGGPGYGQQQFMAGYRAAALALAEPVAVSPQQLRPMDDRTQMWRDLVSDKGFDAANREWPKLDPERGGPGYTRN